MITTIIDRGNLRQYEELLVPEAAQMIRSGTPIFALGAVEKGVACGALAGGPWNGCFEILSFFVAREQRKRGAGSALLNELVRIASMQEGLHKIKCCFQCRSVEQEELAIFLQKRGFQGRNADGGIESYLMLEATG